MTDSREIVDIPLPKFLLKTLKKHLLKLSRGVKPCKLLEKNLTEEFPRPRNHKSVNADYGDK